MSALSERRKLLSWAPLLVAVLVIASAAALVWVYVTQYRVDRQTDAAAQKVAVSVASEAAVTLLSYTPETIDADLAAARQVMTGEFATYYGKFTADIVGPAARDRGVKADAEVVEAAAMDVDPDRAKVLVFLTQQTVSTERPEPALTASSVVVTLSKVDGTWLVSAFDPV
ncbi:hypothetical protein ACAG25_14030 [Mycobacterium sp. pV006]|uniref:hypothetical protein n=1 Tax=Mycobacterium sp. pV006 TaxID=3238983 RepID=UPI00351BC73C